MHRRRSRTSRSKLRVQERRGSAKGTGTTGRQRQSRHSIRGTAAKTVTGLRPIGGADQLRGAVPRCTMFRLWHFGQAMTGFEERIRRTTPPAREGID